MPGTGQFQSITTDIAKQHFRNVEGPSGLNIKMNQRKMADKMKAIVSME